MPSQFIHLSVHSDFSLSEGAIRLKELAKTCKSLNMPAVAVTDSGNLFGALEFSMAAVDNGVQPIVGCVLKITPPESADASSPKNPVKLQKIEYDRILLLAQNKVGYRNLIELSSCSFLDTPRGEEPHITWEWLEKNSAGLIALCRNKDGSVGRLLLNGQKTAAEETLLKLKKIFDGRFYIELMRHGLEEETRIEPELIALAQKHDIPLVATNDCYFATRDMHAAHDALLCIADGRYISENDRRRVTPEHYFKTPDEMCQLFADIPEAISNTLVIARRCSLLLKSAKTAMPAFMATPEEDAAELRKQAVVGLTEHLDKYVYPRDASAEKKQELEKQYRDRLDYELSVITKMGFAGYFLMVSDFMKWTRAHGIPVGPGRGSGAGALTAWSLYITELDPIKFGLLFERFLNPERVSMPDFDIDFCQERRGEVIHYVRERHGHDKVAQIITFGTLQSRAVVRDVGRVLQMPYGQVDKISKLIPQHGQTQHITLKEAIESEPLLKEMMESDETVANLMDIATKLEGLHRHASVHAAGVVISGKPLKETVALYLDPRSDMPVVQFNMKYTELAGLIKFDFLGLKTLTVIQKALALIKQRGDDPKWDIDISMIPLDDKKVYEMLSHGHCVGVFQFESSGMRDTIKRMKPDRIDDLIALGALYRPGPMQNIPQYLRVKHGEEQPTYMHPLLEPILKDTHGIIVYQEQVIKLAMVLAGYSAGGADLLRRAMGKKKKEEMDAQRQVFINGAAKNGIDGELATAIFDQVSKFADYGFNKSHAAAYAIISYQTAWLKTNFPLEFMAASMTMDSGDTDKLNIFRQELNNLGIKLLPPDINQSEASFSVEHLADGSSAIRYSLAAIKGVGADAMQALVAERKQNGVFKDLEDLAERLDTKVMNKRQLESLVCAGACDSLNPNRAQVFAAIEQLTKLAGAKAAEKSSGQANLFGAANSAQNAANSMLKMPEAKPWTLLEKLQHEFEAIGFYLSAHPLDGFSALLKKLGVIKFSQLRASLVSSRSTRFTLAGIVMAKQERTSKNGNRFAFLQASDTSGVFEATVFSEVLSSSRDIMEAGNSVAITVDVQQNEDDLRLTCVKVEDLKVLAEQSSTGLEINLAHEKAIPPLKELLAKCTKGRKTVTVTVDVDNDLTASLSLPGKYSISHDAREKVEQLPGIAGVLEG